MHANYNIIPLHNILYYTQNSFGQKNTDLIKYINWKLLWMKISCMGFIPRIKQQYADLIISLMEWKQPKKPRTLNDVELSKKYNEIFKVYFNKELIFQPKEFRYFYLLQRIEAAGSKNLMQKYNESFFNKIGNNTYRINKTSKLFFQFLQSEIINNNHRNTTDANSWIWQQRL